ncbi:hypothetical protein V5O48_006514 [Marasmius crinis-equi]|uniref:Uncharacterized protein n=1 Tax=Marasmius crinis-equi TaxID=585013 RepID=A0ABR3FJA8_9AGAR
MSGQTAAGPSRKKAQKKSNNHNTGVPQGADHKHESHGVTADGWIWSTHKTGKMTEKELKEWEETYMWHALASKEHSSTQGHQAYANEHTDMYEALRLDCVDKYKGCGLPILCNIPAGLTLADQALLFWEAESKYFTFDWSKKLVFKDPMCHASGFRDIQKEETPKRKQEDDEDEEEDD